MIRLRILGPGDPSTEPPGTFNRLLFFFIMEGGTVLNRVAFPKLPPEERGESSACTACLTLRRTSALFAVLPLL